MKPLRFPAGWSGARAAIKPYLLSLAASALLFAGCQKNVKSPQTTEAVQCAATSSGQTTGEVRTWYSGLEPQTIWELQQARAATAQYRYDTVNAYKDGYRNIHVDVENMGHHFLKASLVDSVFDFRHPEILVYNGTESGTMELVAVEYALPYDLPEPAGFTGNSDVWDHNRGFGLWLLHAWVWKFNPSGTFNMLNPDVHLR